MFSEALQRFVEETGAQLAIFCDYEGEAIGQASAGPDDFEVKLTGAQLGAVTAELQRLARAYGQEERASYSFATGTTTLLVEALPGNYYLVAAVADAARVPCARWHLAAVARRFEAEL